MKPVFVLLILLCLPAAAADGSNDQPRIPWTFPVSISSDQNAEAQALAHELSTFLGQQGKVNTADDETTPCFRVEIKTSTPGEGGGFLLKIDAKGARLTASDVAALKDGFSFLKSLSAQDRKGVKLAVGTFTTIENPDIRKPAREIAPPRLLTPRGDIAGLPNFARVSDELYRGGQPDETGFRALKQMGVKTVVDLCASHSDRKRLAGLGLRYVHLGCDASNPEEEKAVQFLKVLSNPANHPVFVHCHRGADRTGMMAATYRIMEQGWRIEDAIAELPLFKFGEGNKRVFSFLRFDPNALRKKVGEAKSQVVEIIP